MTTRRERTATVHRDAAGARNAAVAWLVLACCAALLLAHCLVRFGVFPPAAAPGSPSRGDVEALLASVRVVPGRPDVPGYDRSCSRGRPCSFGPSWSDASGAPLGHNGCDTRNDVLGRFLRDTVHAPGTRGCVVVSGTLRDPYTGETIVFTRERGRAVQIDHVYPLAAAWDLGASTWSPEARLHFANDAEYNLVATGARVNGEKSDHTPSAWQPGPTALRCAYAARYLMVAVRYRLPVTAPDHRALSASARLCPDRTG